jgi:hypothetical protein
LLAEETGTVTRFESLEPSRELLLNCTELGNGGTVRAPSNVQYSLLKKLGTPSLKFILGVESMFVFDDSVTLAAS